MEGASFKELRRLVDDLDASTKKLKEQDGLKAAPKVMQEMHILATSLQKTRPWAIGTALFFSLLGGGLLGTAAGFWYTKSQQIDMNGYGITVVKNDDMTQIYIPMQYEVLPHKEQFWLISLDNPNKPRTAE
jgi:hypothetical protein